MGKNERKGRSDESYTRNTEAVLKVKDERLESYRLQWASHRIFDLHTLTFPLILIDSATFCVLLIQFIYSTNM